MPIHIVKQPISREELKSIAQERYGDLVKAVVDVEQGIMAIGGELHADEDLELTEKEESKRENTWGINIYPEKSIALTQLDKNGQNLKFPRLSYTVTQKIYNIPKLVKNIINEYNTDIDSGKAVTKNIFGRDKDRFYFYCNLDNI